MKDDNTDSIFQLKKDRIGFLRAKIVDLVTDKLLIEAAIDEYEKDLNKAYESLNGRKI